MEIPELYGKILDKSIVVVGLDQHFNPEEDGIATVVIPGMQRARETAPQDQSLPERFLGLMLAAAWSSTELAYPTEVDVTFEMQPDQEVDVARVFAKARQVLSKDSSQKLVTVRIPLPQGY